MKQPGAVETSGGSIHVSRLADSKLIDPFQRGSAAAADDGGAIAADERVVDGGRAPRAVHFWAVLLRRGLCGGFGWGHH